jgi:hypothetical protein
MGSDSLFVVYFMRRLAALDNGTYQKLRTNGAYGDMVHVQRGSTERLDMLKDTFRREGFVSLPYFVPDHMVEVLDVQVMRLLGHAVRVEGTTTMGAPERMWHSHAGMARGTPTIIPRIHASKDVLGLVRDITGERLFAAGTCGNQFAINSLREKEDTFGGHIDDGYYRVVLVLMAHAPESPVMGGLLSYVPGGRELSELDGPNARYSYLMQGDAYIMQGSSMVHCVTPLTVSGTRRTSIVLGYTAEESQAAAVAGSN